jgi:hypothetical protein
MASQSHPLAERAMLARLTIKKWSPVKVDRGVTEEIALRKGADRTAAGVYQKCLIARSALKELTKVGGEARTYHYEHTLPWLDNGQRILTAKAHLKYVAEMDKFRTEFLRLAADLSRNFDGYVSQARVTLGSMFDATEYPSREDILAKHSFDYGIDPIPDAPDFRVKLPEAELARLRQDIHRRAQEAMVEANVEMWRRVHETVAHMAKTLANPEGKFKNTLVSNVADLADIMDEMNVAEDGELTTLAEELKRSISGLDPETLRNDEGERKAAATAAQDVAARALRKMSGYGRKQS